MIIKGPIKVKLPPYIVTMKDISIDPADRSVGIMSESIADFQIVKIAQRGKSLRGAERKMIAKHIYDLYEEQDKRADDIQERIFNELYKIQKKEMMKHWKKYKKKGGKMSRREFVSEYT